MQGEGVCNIKPVGCEALVPTRCGVAVSLGDCERPGITGHKGISVLAPKNSTLNLFFRSCEICPACPLHVAVPASV